MKKRIIDPDGMIICRTCLEVKPRTVEFYSRNNRDKTGLHKICKLCDNKRRTEKEREKHYHNHKRICPSCNSFFWASLSAVNKGKRRGFSGGMFCSRDCIINLGYSGMTGKSWDGKRKGENNPNSILTDAIVKDIKLALKHGERNTDIALTYGIGRALVSSIKHNRSWKHVSI